MGKYFYKFTADDWDRILFLRGKRNECGSKVAYFQLKVLQSASGTNTLKGYLIGSTDSPMCSFCNVEIETIERFS